MGGVKSALHVHLDKFTLHVVNTRVGFTLHATVETADGCTAIKLVVVPTAAAFLYKFGGAPGLVTKLYTTVLLLGGSLSGLARP